MLPLMETYKLFKLEMYAHFQFCSQSGINKSKKMSEASQNRREPGESVDSKFKSCLLSFFTPRYWNQMK